MKVALGFMWVFAGGVLWTLLVSLDFGLFVRLNIFPIPYSISLNVRSLVP